MSRLVRRYDLYLPIRYNDGQDIPESTFVQVEDRLTARFGGCTMVQQRNPLRGVWVFQNQRYVDDIIIVTAVDFEYAEEDRDQFFVEYKDELKTLFEQIDLLILAQTVTSI